MDFGDIVDAVDVAIEECRRFGETPSTVRVPYAWYALLSNEACANGLRAGRHDSQDGVLTMFCATGTVSLVPDARLASVALPVNGAEKANP